MFQECYSTKDVSIAKRSRLEDYNDLCITTWNGKRISLYRKQPLQIQDQNSNNYHRPINYMLDKMELSTWNQIYQSSQSTDHSKSIINDVQLWTDKYSPKKYDELLSHDQINVQVLKWLLQWKDTNSCVIEKKILLLAGKPGLGKTTLVHVLGKQCQFNIVEINASDERSSSILIDKITMIISMNGMNGKPNMLILDEIDGAYDGDSSIHGTSFMNFLIQLCTSTYSNESNDTKKTKKQIILKRPIICICNDLYSPILYGLRQVAQIVNMIKPSSLRMYQRLSSICQEEDIIFDSSSLHRLIELTDGDMRECLHTIQFIQNRNASDDKELTIQNIERYIKDSNTSYYQLWNDIFSFVDNSPKHDQSLSSLSYKIFKLQEKFMLKGITELEKLFEGCYEQFLQMKFHDQYMKKVVDIYDWISFGEKIMNHILKRDGSSIHIYVLQGYLAYRLCMFGLYFASPIIQQSFINLSFPKIFYELRKNTKDNQSIVRNWQISCRFEAFKPDIICDTLPFLVSRYENINGYDHGLLKIPKIQSKQIHLMNDSDKKKMNIFIQRVDSLGLTYRLSTTDRVSKTRFNEPVVRYELSPPLHLLRLESFNPIFHSDDLDMSIQYTKQYISQMILEQKIIKMNKSNTSENQVQNAKQINITTLKQEKRDFFGRLIKETLESSMITINSNIIESLDSAIFYRYHEKYSNAVKRSIKAKEWL